MLDAQQQLALFQFMSEQIPGVVWATDMQLRFTASFGAGLKDLQLRPSEVVGTRVAEYLQTSDENNVALAAHRQALSGSSVDYEFEWQGRIYLTHVQPLMDQENTIVGCVGFAHDITERSRAHRALHESQRTLWTLMSNLPGMAYRCRNAPDWSMEFVSEGCRQLTGYRASQLTDEGDINYGDVIHPDDRQTVWDQVQQAICRREWFQLEYRIITNVGEEKWVWEQGVGVFSDAGQLEAIEGFITDITGRKRAQLELQEARDDLEHRVEIRTAELCESNQQLEQEVQERRLAEKSLQKEREALRRMLQASDRERQLITYEIHDGVAQRLIGALMQFEAYPRLANSDSSRAEAAFESGMSTLRQASAEVRALMNRTTTSVLEEFGVAAAIADFVNQMLESPSAPQITYQCTARFMRLVPVLENAIYRIAQEAITNAVIHSKSARVQVTLSRSDDELALEVQDWGAGFSAGEVGDDRYGLTGIRERTRLVGKKLIIESAPGQGTRILATFPLQYRRGEGGMESPAQ